MNKQMKTQLHRLYLGLPQGGNHVELTQERTINHNKDVVLMLEH